MDSIIYEDFCTTDDQPPFPTLYNTLSGGDLHRIHNEFLHYKENPIEEFLKKFNESDSNRFLLKKNRFLICKVFILKSREDILEFNPYLSKIDNYNYKTQNFDLKDTKTVVVVFLSSIGADLMIKLIKFVLFLKRL